MTDPIRRDPRRLFSESQRREVHSRQRGNCDGCGQPLPDDFHMHHVTPWGLGGPTEVSNALGVCQQCHLRQPVHSLPGITPREWQTAALTQILDKLIGGDFATVAAAPGAGKTMFTGLVVRELLSRGAIDRVSIFVPNGNLRLQWATELGKLGIPVEPDPRYLIEKAGYVGNVLTYAKLNPDNASRLAEDDRRTLYVLDEVHHLGRDEDGGHKSWSLGVGKLVGTVRAPQQPVLNLTGTPFRSVSGERIATCDYTRTEGDTIELVTDYEVTTDKLVEEGHLRHLQVHSYDAGLRVVNLRDGDVRDSRVLDLDKMEGSVQSVAVRALINDVAGFIHPVLESLVSVLAMQMAALDGHHVKGLVICDNQRQADVVHSAALERLSLPPRALLKAVSDEGAEARRAIEDFRSSREPSILVAVRMVSEGFDAPDVSAIAYMSTWTAPLFIQQMVARARRVTDIERRLGRIPAEVIIPGSPAMVKAFVENVQPGTTAGPRCPACNREQEACYCLRPIVDKVCARCGLPRKICPCPKGEWDGPWADPAVAVEVTDAAEQARLHRDGEEIDQELMAQIRRAAAGELDEVHVPAATVVMQRALLSNPFLVSEYVANERRRSDGGAQ